jgi:hypothetical protein
MLPFAILHIVRIIHDFKSRCSQRLKIFSLDILESKSYVRAQSIFIYNSSFAPLVVVDLLVPSSLKSEQLQRRIDTTATSSA